MSMRNQPSRALIPRVYPGSSDVRSNSFNAYYAVAFDFDAASGMDSFLSINFAMPGPV
jgi:hypothetical protein